MEKESYKKIKKYFIHMGKRSKLWRIPAVAGLAVSMFGYRLYEHCWGKIRRFVCVVFILCCFIIGSSFAFPVFYGEGGFVSAKEKELGEINLLDPAFSVKEVESPKQETADEQDSLEIYVEGDSCGLEGEDQYQYLLDEILDERIPVSKDIVDEGDTLSAGNQKKKAVFDREDWKLVLINKQHPIPEDYSFTLGPIKTMKGTMKCDERIINDLISMMQAAKEDGINLAICSPYRDMNWQKVLFNRKIKAYMANDMTYMEAYKLASQTVTVPGASEHQVGLAIDIVSDTYFTLDEGFAETDAGIWLEEHCAEYGFILRYPKGKEYITSIEFEPWHFRYVGKEAAGVIMGEGLCLEEFWEKYM